MWWIFFEKYFEVKISEKIEIWKDLLEYLICEILFMIYQQKNDHCYRLGWGWELVLFAKNIYIYIYMCGNKN